MAHKTFVATVQIVVEVDTWEDACEWISGLMEQAVGNEPFDWGYVKVGGQYLYPTERLLSDDWTIEEA